MKNNEADIAARLAKSPFGERLFTEESMAAVERRIRQGDSAGADRRRRMRYWHWASATVCVVLLIGAIVLYRDIAAPRTATPSPTASMQMFGTYQYTMVIPDDWEAELPMEDDPRANFYRERQIVGGVRLITDLDAALLGTDPAFDEKWDIGGVMAQVKYAKTGFVDDRGAAQEKHRFIYDIYVPGSELVYRLSFENVTESLASQVARSFRHVPNPLDDTPPVLPSSEEGGF